MLSQILKTSIFLILFSIGCKKGESSHREIMNLPNEKLQTDDKIISKITNDIFTLKIETFFTKDTLNVVDYKEDKYSSPIITNQELLFFKDDKLIKHLKLSIRNIKKKTITDRVIGALQTPIYKACLSHSKEDYYVIYGSDYCNGSECPEFIGIYSMAGNVIYEGFSNEKKKISLKDILTKNEIDLNKLTDCIKIEVFEKL